MNNVFSSEYIEQIKILAIPCQGEVAVEEERIDVEGDWERGEGRWSLYSADSGLVENYDGLSWYILDPPSGKVNQ